MLKHLKLKNIGPAANMELAFGKRLNLITGDNGLGKSFLLDIAWWTMTRKWPAEINPKLAGGKKALPRGDGMATIDFSFTGKSKPEEYISNFLRREQAWAGRQGRPANPGLVFYAMVRKTITRLKLNSAENKEMRAKHFVRYLRKKDEEALKELSPFVWCEANRQGMLRGC